MRLAIALVAVATVANAQPAPAPLAAIGLDEQLGRRVPLDVPFETPGAGHVSLARYIDGTRPILLVIAYSRCAMLCNVVLRGLREAIPRLEHVPGRDFRIVLVGLDHQETIDEASRAQATLLGALPRPDREAWPYLIGPRTSIDAVASAIGFRYAWDPRTEQYAHPAVIVMLTPDGRVSRYLQGARFEPAAIDDALADAAVGRMLSSDAADVLRCFRFDPASRIAGDRVASFLKGGAALVLALLVGAIAGLLARERRARKAAP